MEMLERSVDELKLVTAEVAKQTAQMEEMKNEINAIKSSISSQGPPQEINFDEMTARISELMDSNKTLKEEVAGLLPVLEEIQEKLRQPPPHPFPKQAESVEKIKSIVAKMETTLMEV
jgi:DNA repair ATPase RecN